jgi:hypothetical protein
MTIGLDARSLIAAGYSVAQLRKAGLQYDQLKDAGCKDAELEDGGFITQKNWKYFFLNAPGRFYCENFWNNCNSCCLDCCGKICCDLDSCSATFLGVVIVLWAITQSLLCAYVPDFFKYGNDCFYVTWGIACFFISLRSCFCCDVMYFILFKIPKTLLGRVVELCFREKQYSAFEYSAFD